MNLSRDYTAVRVAMTIIDEKFHTTENGLEGRWLDTKERLSMEDIEQLRQEGWRLLGKNVPRDGGGFTHVLTRWKEKPG